MDKTEKTLTSVTEFRGKVLTLYRDTVLTPAGREAEREIVRHRGAVAVAAVTGQGEIYLVRQYRYALGREFLEIPAGKLEPGEDPAEAALRELAEETGARAEKLEPLGVIIPTCGYSDEKIYLYLATGLTAGETNFDEDEFLDILKLPLEKAYDMALRGEIEDAKTLSALCKVNLLYSDKGGAYGKNRR